MKNILARGGIEFLAVLLGISASLWIDNNNKKEDLGLQRDETYQLFENQTDSLLSYTNNMLNYYEIETYSDFFEDIPQLFYMFQVYNKSIQEYLYMELI